MPKAVSILFAAIGVGLIMFGIMNMVGAAKFREMATQANGEVLRLIAIQDDDGTTYAPEVKFTAADGTEIIFTSDYSTNPPSDSVGETAKVLYLPEDPYRARLDDAGSTYLGGIILMIFGLLFGGFGFIPALYTRMK